MATDFGTTAFGIVALSADTEVEVTLDRYHGYKIIHLGVDVSGNDDADSAKAAYLATASGDIAADWAADAGKYVLLDGGTVEIGPGIPTLYLISTSGADAALQFVRLGPAENA
jgi:hypothetical protein